MPYQKRGGKAISELCPFYKKNNGATIGHYKLKTVVEIYLIDATRNSLVGGTSGPASISSHPFSGVDRLRFTVMLLALDAPSHITPSEA